MCEGCLKPRQQLPVLGQSMGDQGCEQKCLGVTGPLPGAIAQASTPDLGHKKAPCDARGRVMGTIPLCMLSSTPDLVVVRRWAPGLSVARSSAQRMTLQCEPGVPGNPAQTRSSLRKQKRYHYVWDLDDGAPRFARHTKRDRLKLFVDSDGDGLFTKADALVGRARIKRPFRGQGRGQLLEEVSFGTILTFNGLKPSIEGLHGDLPTVVGVCFRSPAGDEVAVFQQVLQEQLV
jgi:hypothetical protein